MSGALGYERLRVVPEADWEEDEPRLEARGGAGADAEASGLWLLLDRLFFAAVGAVQGAAHGWANPSWEWARSDADEEADAPPIPIEAVMTRTVQVIAPDASLEEAARRLWDQDCGALPVVDGASGRRVLGMITDRDVCMAAWSRRAPLHEIRVDGVMARDVRLCRMGDPIGEARRRMGESQVRRLPVVDEDGDLAGVITLADLVRHALEAGPEMRRAEATAVLETLGAVGTPLRTAPSAD